MFQKTSSANSSVGWSLVGRHQQKTPIEPPKPDFATIQIQFTNACRIHRYLGINKWAKRIRQAMPDGAVYVLIQQNGKSCIERTTCGKSCIERTTCGKSCIERTTCGQSFNANLLLASDINWPDEPNDPEFRVEYFFQCHYDRNIWILKEIFRGDNEILHDLLIDSNKYHV